MPPSYTLSEYKKLVEKHLAKKPTFEVKAKYLLDNIKVLSAGKSERENAFELVKYTFERVLRLYEEFERPAPKCVPAYMGNRIFEEIDLYYVSIVSIIDAVFSEETLLEQF